MSRLLDVAMGGATIHVSSAPQHDWFWDEVSRGQWEPNTIRILSDQIGPDTLYIDVGTWIGPTVLLGATRARRVVGVEPDAVAMAALLQNLSLNPELKQRVALHNHALAAQDGPLTMWSQDFGNSMTTSVPGRGANSMTFLAMGVSKFLDMVIKDEPHVFIKVDVESGEYTLVPALCAELRRRGIKADLYVSFHASIMIDEQRSFKAWAENLARNGSLLAALADYGTVHTYDNGWHPAEAKVGGLAEFSSWLDTGGTDHTFYVKAA